MKSNSLPFCDEKVWEYLKWNSYTLQSKKIFYVATPKVACTTLKWWFADLAGASVDVQNEKTSAESTADLIIHDALYKVTSGVTGLSTSELIQQVASSKYFRFSVVRNPYKRIFSAWQSKLFLREHLQGRNYKGLHFYEREIRTKNEFIHAFEEFLEYISLNESPFFHDIHWALQYDLLRPDLIDYSIVSKIEEPSSLVDSLRDRVGASFVNPFLIRSANESLIPYSPELFTDKGKALVRKMYAKDFEEFDYDFDLPCSEIVFPESSFDLAIKASFIIRSRNERLLEVHENISSMAERISTSIIQAKVTEIDAQKAIIDEKTEGMRKMEQMILNRDESIKAQTALIDDRDSGMRKMEQMILDRDEAIKAHTALIDDRDSGMRKMEQMILDRDEAIKAHTALIDDRDLGMRKMEQMILDRDDSIKAQTALIEERDSGMRKMEQMILDRDEAIKAQAALIDDRDLGMGKMEQMILDRDEAIKVQAALINDRDLGMRKMGQTIQDHDAILQEKSTIISAQLDVIKVQSTELEYYKNSKLVKFAKNIRILK